MTEALVEYIKEEHTEVRRQRVEAAPHARTVWLRVGVQQFCVTPQYVETADEAEFMRDMLASALGHLVQDGLPYVLPAGELRPEDVSRAAELASFFENSERVVVSRSDGALLRKLIRLASAASAT
ncbi:hypothetical protein F6X40_27555 [Paraburkholderia sp. UCT31]|uniref:hypothetical protein n=1 Tax=Paraburkholderia sp. UCT31 TaxID=2615209 RepID=UPI0016553C9B|nr:hypothetical protein [Paraburkholderia sp. UCT31]MBC8740417.1 hypothetical protein [Paraburkholderia sp. UCT31]